MRHLIVIAMTALATTAAFGFRPGSAGYVATWLGESGGGAAIPTGAVIELKFDSDASDTSGNGYNGTLVGSPTVSGTLVLNGSSQLVKWDTGGFVNFFETTTNLTAAGWFKTSNGSTRQTLFGEAFSTVSHVEMNLGGTGLLRSWWNNDSGTAFAQSTNNLADDAWHFFATSLQGTTNITLVIDMTQTQTAAIASADDRTTTGSADLPSIGNFFSSIGGTGTAWFAGSFDNLRAYDRVLTEEEIQQLYDEGHD